MPDWNKKIMSALIAFEGELNSIVREVRNYNNLVSSTVVHDRCL